MWNRRALLICLLLVSAPAFAAAPPAPPGITLREAALQGDLARVKQFVAQTPGILRSKAGIGTLCMAAYSGNKALVLFLLAHGSAVNEKDYDGASPLHQAAAGGNSAIAALLIKRGANVRQRRLDGWTPLHAAVASGDQPTVTLLLAKGAQINARGGVHRETPVQTAIRYRNSEIATYLRKHGGKA